MYYKARYYPICTKEVRKRLTAINATRLLRKSHFCFIEYFTEGKKACLKIEEGTGKTIVTSESMNNEKDFDGKSTSTLTLRGSFSRDFSQIFDRLNLSGGQIKEFYRELWMVKGIDTPDTRVFIEWWPGLYPLIILESSREYAIQHLESILGLEKQTSKDIIEMYQYELGWSVERFHETKSLSFFKFPTKELPEIS